MFIDNENWNRSSRVEHSISTLVAGSMATG